MTELASKLFQFTRFKRGLDTVYEILVDQEKLFTNQWNLLTLGLVYGILYDKKLENKNRKGIIEITSISDRHIQDILCICYLILDDGRPPKEIYELMWDYADGGVQEIYGMYNETKNIDIANIIRDAEKRWNERVHSLHNINL